MSLSDSAAQWEITVAHKWKVVALELSSWLEDKYKQGLTKAQIKDYIHVRRYKLIRHSSSSMDGWMDGW